MGISASRGSEARRDLVSNTTLRLPGVLTASTFTGRHTEVTVYGKQLSYGPYCGIEDSKARKVWQLRPGHLLEVGVR